MAGGVLTKDEKQKIQRIKDNLSAEGYEVPQLLNHSFHQGMRVIVTSAIPDENLASGEEIITKVLVPQVNKDDKMVQTAQIEVTVGTKKGGLTKEEWLKEQTTTQAETKPNEKPPTVEDVEDENNAEDDDILNEAEDRRKKGRFTHLGNEYVRQAKDTESPKGKTGMVRFTNEPGGGGIVVPFKYKLVEASTLQASHNAGIPNPMHFIPEAQPKSRNDAGSKAAEDNFAERPRGPELGDKADAFGGAPVVNTRNEVIQGNNRAAGLRKGATNNTQGSREYNQWLSDNAADFGFTPEQVAGMENPILVREVDTTDEGAIELGNYDVKDLETGGKRRVDPVAISRRISPAKKQRIVEIVLTSDETLNAQIRKNIKQLWPILSPFLNQSHRDTMMRDGELTEAGAKDIEAIIQQFLFDNAPAGMADLFDQLPASAQSAILKSLPSIINKNSRLGLVKDVQNAMIALNEFLASQVDNIGEWVNQLSMFGDGKKPSEVYTPLEIAIATLMDKIGNKVNGKPFTMTNLVNMFKGYAELVNGKEGDLMNPEGTAAIPKKEAVKQLKRAGTVRGAADIWAGNNPARRSSSTIKKADDKVNTAKANATGAGLSARKINRIVKKTSR